MQNTATASNHIVGIFPNRQEAILAVEELHNVGISDKDIDMEWKDESGQIVSNQKDQRRSKESRGLIEYLKQVFRGDDYEQSNITKDEFVGYYSSELDTGKTLVAVNADGKWQDVIEIFDKHHALDSYDKPEGLDLEATQERRLRLRKEVLRVNKERFQSGEVQVRKEVVTHTETIEVPLQREEVVIERRPLSESAEAIPGDTIVAGTSTEEIRIPVYEERVEVSKVTVPKEEVVIKKETQQATEEFVESVSEEQLNVEQVEAREEKLRTSRRRDSSLDDEGARI